MEAADVGDAEAAGAVESYTDPDATTTEPSA
jgi:hypothetical protein